MGIIKGRGTKGVAGLDTKHIKLLALANRQLDLLQLSTIKVRIWNHLYQLPVD